MPTQTISQNHIQNALKIAQTAFNHVNWQDLEKTIRITVRNLDNVIDENYYSTPEAKNANKKHRPIGMGVMGWQEMLHQLNINMESKEAIELSDILFEFISFIAIDESSNLAEKKGKYETFEGSKWDREIFPIDALEEYLTQNRKVVNSDFSRKLDWQSLKQKVKKTGLRNSQLLAIAPTRSISYIAGTSPSIEPWDSNLFTEVGMTGKYQMINTKLIDELENLGLWNEEVVEQIKQSDGSIQSISTIPDHVKQKYKTAWEIHPKYIISQNARRQKWIDMGISFNLWLPNNNGRDAQRIYKEVFDSGHKTTYYLHSKSRTQTEKIGTQKVGKINLNATGKTISNLNISKRDISTSSNLDFSKSTVKTSSTQNAIGDTDLQKRIQETFEKTAQLKPRQVCDMTDPNCEACQ